MINEQKYQNVHFIGVGGVGLSRLAKYFLLQNKTVSGSDLRANEFTHQLVKLGMKFFVGHEAKNLPQTCDLVVYSIAIPGDNPEISAAKERGIDILSHFEVLGRISEAFKTIAVAGTNGKSTTTSLIGLVLEEAGLDPTVFVGSAVAAWHGNLRAGKSQYLVVEADELQRQFLSLSPFALVLTNVEVDHLDYYKDLNDIFSAFRELLQKVPQEGFVAYNKDDPGSVAVMEQQKHPRIVSFGRSSGSVKLLKVSHGYQKQLVEISIRGKKEKFELKIPGLFNVYNALAAIAASADLNIPFETVRTVLEKFTGIWRRFQILGAYQNALVISDYGHHPTALLETVLGTKEFYPGKKILLVFQPHQRARTRNLYQEFLANIKLAAPDGVILVEIYDVAGREAEDKRTVSSRDLMLEVSKTRSEVYYAADRVHALGLIKKHAAEYDIVLVMGAGDIYLAAEALFTKE